MSDMKSDDYIIYSLDLCILPRYLGPSIKTGMRKKSKRRVIFTKEIANLERRKLIIGECPSLLDCKIFDFVSYHLN